MIYKGTWAYVSVFVHLYERTCGNTSVPAVYILNVSTPINKDIYIAMLLKTYLCLRTYTQTYMCRRNGTVRMIAKYIVF